VPVAALVLLAACGSSDNPTTPPPSPPTSSSCSSAAPVTAEVALRTTLVATGFSQPVDLKSPAGDCRVFVVQQGGRIRILRDGAVLPTPFLDVSSRIASGGERGLLGLAFHPRYADNGRFFIYYTDRSGDINVAEYHASPSSDTADAGSEKRILLIGHQQFSNHNGGSLLFGPDGFLYFGVGDGGSGGDPFGSGQRLNTHLGKIHRIDIDGGNPYSVPQSNPFVSRSGAFPEIFYYGLRNPWRFTFDRVTGDVIIADVGQGAVEEVDLGSRGGGDNFGWNVTEGSSCYPPSTSNCNRTGFTLPLVDYRHEGGACSVTGGVVYRGRRMPFLAGTYFYSDYCTPFVRSFRVQGGAAVDRRDRTGELGKGLNAVSSFGTDADGEAYILDHADGEIYRIDPAS
jgi:glucose/arabinose dehydrogenase